MCDLTDPRILETYTAIVENEPTNWLILGYNDTRDVISLYSKGSEGLGEFRNNLSQEVLYGFVRVEDRFILITWVPEQISGVRRARALVHSRSVASLLKLQHAQITASTLMDLSDVNIRTRLKLGDNQIPSSRRSSAISQNRLSQQFSELPTVPAIPNPPPHMDQDQSQYDEFVEANEEFPTPPVSTSSYHAAPAPTETVPTESVSNELNSTESAPTEIVPIGLAPTESVPSTEPREEIGELELQRRRKEEDQAKLLMLKKKQEEEEAKRKKVEEEKRKAAAAAAAAAEEEARRVAAEERAKKLQEERILREKLKAERMAEEKKLLQQRLLEAERNKEVVLSGFLSIQPSASPFWRRLYFDIKGKAMNFYRDEFSSKPIITLDLNKVKRLSKADIDIEAFVPNSFVLETQQNGSYQLFTDDKKSLETILTALQTVI
ncbi:MAG: hypothetical protein EXX96DRAFT_563796 [Benjaminiella poitrasii]|nr:MAG: hypothetical protein EXX96DRAFT_563796 [Benjaminiella poitrasii]